MKKEEQVVLFEYLANMRALIYSEQSKTTIQQIKDKDIVVFIGNTRGGKSTLVNYVIGNELKAVKVKRKLFKIETTNEALGPKIGAGAQSETTIPTPWTSSKIKGMIVDAPGFDDNRGEVQDVANAFYIKELLTHANSVKFVLISDINDIMNDNINQFITFIDKIYTILPRCDVLPKGMVIVFNKDREGATKEEVCDELREKIIDQERIQIKNRCLISYAIDNKDQIVISRMPTREGIISDNGVFGNLIDIINGKALALTKDRLGEVTPGISDRSRIFLLEAHAYFTEFKELDSILLVAENAFMNQLDNYDIKVGASVAHMEEMKTKLSNLEAQLTEITQTKLKFEDLLLKLGQILPQVSELKEGSDIFVKLMFIEFVDQILKIEDSNILAVKVNATFSNMKNKIAVKKINVQEKMSEVSAAEANKKIVELNEMRHKEEIENLKKLNELQQRQIAELSRIREENKKKKGCAIL